MKNISPDSNLRIDFEIKLTAGSDVIASIKGSPEIPSFVAPDATSDCNRIFESVFEAFIHRPCAIGVNRFVDGILKSNMEKRKQESKPTVPRVGNDLPLPPVAETLAKTWPTDKAA